jgi:hypothetical protein
MLLPLRRLAPLSLLAVLAGTGAVASAAPPAGRGRPEPEPPAQDQRALSDSVRRAQRATRGQVLSAERVQADGRDVNRVKLVDDRGRVRVFWDDPQPRRGEDPPTRRDDSDDPNL